MLQSTLVRTHFTLGQINSSGSTLSSSPVRATIRSVFPGTWFHFNTQLQMCKQPVAKCQASTFCPIVTWVSLPTVFHPRLDTGVLIKFDLLTLVWNRLLAMVYIEWAQWTCVTVRVQVALLISIASSGITSFRPSFTAAGIMSLFMKGQVYALCRAPTNTMGHNLKIMQLCAKEAPVTLLTIFYIYR